MRWRILLDGSGSKHAVLLPRSVVINTARFISHIQLGDYNEALQLAKQVGTNQIDTYTGQCTETALLLLSQHGSMDDSDRMRDIIRQLLEIVMQTGSAKAINQGSLHAAIESKSKTALNFLMAQPTIDINAVSPIMGLTPLMVAVQVGDVDTIEMLLSRFPKLNIYARNAAGRTAYQHWKKFGMAKNTLVRNSIHRTRLLYQIERLLVIAQEHHNLFQHALQHLSSSLEMPFPLLHIITSFLT